MDRCQSAIDFDLSGDVTRAVTAPGSPPPTEAENIAGVWGPLGVLLNFSILVAAGLWYRHRPGIHKRLMVFALLPLAFESILHLIGVLVGRVPASQGVILGIGVTFTILLFSVPAIHDKVSQGRIHPVSVWVPILSFVWTTVLNVVVSQSVAGYKLAAWLVR
jgi:hypothetical protein